MSFKNYKKEGEEYGVGGDGDWMNLEEGANKIRVVTDFVVFGTHFDEKLNKSFVCLGKEKCEYCKLKIKPRVQFKGWVIDRKDSKIKILTVGWKINQAIGELANSEEYGFEIIPSYDITINRAGTGLGTKYSVLADRKDTPLTDEEKEQIDELQSPEEVIEAMKTKLIAEINGEEKEIDAKDAVK